MGCEGLEDLLETGEIRSERVISTVRSCLEPIQQAQVDVLGLGCTHFPFLRHRIKRMIGVSYETDVPRAQQIIVDATETVERVLRVPKTRCLLRGFGDNSIELEVRFWISDPQNGVNNVTSEVLVAIWTAFKENGVEFPFPQRDIHIREAIPVRMEDATPGD